LKWNLIRGILACVVPLVGGASITPSYDWEKIYLSAVHETDNEKMASRILEARSLAERDEPNSSPGTSKSGNGTA
jgi:hypothetical protein